MLQVRLCPHGSQGHRTLTKLKCHGRDRTDALWTGSGRRGADALPAGIDVHFFSTCIANERDVPFASQLDRQVGETAVAIEEVVCQREQQEKTLGVELTVDL